MESAFRPWPTMLTKNWSEERHKAYEELHVFLARRAAGDLEVQRHQRKIDFHHRPVRLQHADTPFLSFGVPIQVENRGFRLAADVNESHTIASVSASSGSKGGVWRCCFSLQSASLSQQSDSQLSSHRDKSTLHYGERIIVQTCNEPCMVLCYQSPNESSQRALRFTPQKGADSCWQVMSVDPVNRDMLIGLPVANGDNVILRHCLTGQLLCLEARPKSTDFGTEQVVSARTALDVRRRNDLQKVQEGNILGSLGPNVGCENCWRLSLATDNEDVSDA